MLMRNRLYIYPFIEPKLCPQGWRREGGGAASNRVFNQDSLDGQLPWIFLLELGTLTIENSVIR
jgi:hypothetical protein